MNAQRNQSVEGVRFCILNPTLGAGGQGAVAKARFAATAAGGAEVALKSLPMAPNRLARSRALTRLALPSFSPYLAAPLLAERRGGEILTVAPFAPGVGQDDDQPRTLAETLEIAHAFACQWAILEERGVAHGDFAPLNIRVTPEGAVHLIDFDAFAYKDPAVPPPDVAGQHMMMAPELRAGAAAPSIQSDRFAAAVLLNLILLGRHPADGLADTPNALAQVLQGDAWPERRRAPHPDEVPIDALGLELAALFDAAFSRDMAKRPTADQWRRGLQRGLLDLRLHACGGVFVRAGPVLACPWCGATLSRPEPAVGLRALSPLNATPRWLDLPERTYVSLGRNTTPGLGLRVSARHLELQRQGDRVEIRCFSRNGTWEDVRGRRVQRYHMALQIPAAKQLVLGDDPVQIEFSAP